MDQRISAYRASLSFFVMTERLLDDLLKFSDVCVCEGFSESLVFFSCSAAYAGGSHPDTIAILFYAVYLPHVG